MEDNNPPLEFTRDLIQAGYQPYQSDEENQILRKYNLSRDESISTPKSRVYNNNSSGEAYVVYPGTKDWKDALTDAVIGVGGLYTNPEYFLPRFHEGKQVAKQAEAKYGKHKVTAIGHSLGGAVASSSGVKKRITYNRAVGLYQLGKQIQPGQQDYRTRYDPVSFLLKASRYARGSGIKEFRRGRGFLDSHKTKHLY